MKGGGDCWDWSRMKDGDSSINECSEFVPMTEISMAQKAMYSLKVSTDDGGGFRISISDAFLHADFRTVHTETMEEGVEEVLDSISNWIKYMEDCVSVLASSVGNAKSVTEYSKEDNETINNPCSETRKRFNTLLRGFPRNIQLNYRFVSKKDHAMAQIRIYNVDGVLKFTVFSRAFGGFVGISEYCRMNKDNAGMVKVILGEFMDFLNFVDSLRKEIERNASPKNK